MARNKKRQKFSTASQILKFSQPFWAALWTVLYVRSLRFASSDSTRDKVTSVVCLGFWLEAIGATIASFGQPIYRLPANLTIMLGIAVGASGIDRRQGANKAEALSQTNNPDATF